MMSARREAQVEAVVVGEVGPDEPVLWRGSPQPGWRLRRSDLVVVPASLVLALLSMATAAGLVGTLVDPPVRDGVVAEVGVGDVAFVGLASALLLGAATYGLVGRFVWHGYRARRTTYALTDRRVLVVEVLRSVGICSLPLAQVVGVRSIANRDGSGSVALGDAGGGLPSEGTLLTAAGMPRNAAAGATGVVLCDVDDVASLLEALRRLGVGVDAPVTR